MLDSFNQFFPSLVFDAAAHTYTVNGVAYISATSLVGRYAPKFESEKVAATVAKKVKVPPDELIQLWDFKRQHSSLVGKEFHFYTEVFIRHGRRVAYNTNMGNRIEEFHLFMEGHNTSIECVACELPIYHPGYRVAGTVDVIFKDKGSGLMTVCDWKTNETMTQKSYKKFLDPISDIPFDNIHKYALQLGIYRKILTECTGMQFNTTDLLIYFPRHTPYQLIQLPCLDDAVNKIMNKWRDEESMTNPGIVI